MGLALITPVLLLFFRLAVYKTHQIAGKRTDGQGDPAALLPLTVTAGADTSEINGINPANRSIFLLVPSEHSTLPNSRKVTIKPVKARNYPTLPAAPKVIRSIIDPTGGRQYMLPLRIAGATARVIIASNLSGASMQIVLQK
jgi:hypothetical protein